MYKWQKKEARRQSFLYKQKHGSLRIIKKEFLGADYKESYLVKCDCGKIFKTFDAKAIIEGKITACSNCREGSIGEERIKAILKKHDINFQREKTFDSCVFPESGAKARFDFFVEGEYLIEFDGEQHFKKVEHWDGDYGFEKRKNHDSYKNEWCKKNNIPLIRIPFWRIDSLMLADLLLETTKFRVV